MRYDLNEIKKKIGKVERAKKKMNWDYDEAFAMYQLNSEGYTVHQLTKHFKIPNATIHKKIELVKHVLNVAEHFGWDTKGIRK